MCAEIKSPKIWSHKKITDNYQSISSCFKKKFVFYWRTSASMQYSSHETPMDARLPLQEEIEEE